VSNSYKKHEVTFVLEGKIPEGFCGFSKKENCNKERITTIFNRVEVEEIWYYLNPHPDKCEECPFCKSKAIKLLFNCSPSNRFFIFNCKNKTSTKCQSSGWHKHYFCDSCKTNMVFFTKK